MTQAYSYIRFSSAQQSRGDSLRRQLMRTERFAEQHGLTLDTSFRDLGVSAYKGANRVKGALASFLAKIESEDVQRGSYLIVENLDRLTREDVLSAVTLFLRIIEAGIVVATLNDDMIYSRQTIIDRPNDLTVSISSFIKGNREQKDKASRLSDAWIEKRDMIVQGSRKKLTRQGPGWFDLQADDPLNDPLTGDWVFNDRAEIVRRVFDLCCAGFGKTAIAARLNDENVASFKGGDGWQQSTVMLLLTDRRVIGELQFHTKVDGHRQPVGEPIKGYFATASGETVVSEDVFYRAQAEIRRRWSGAGVGQKGKVPNLFNRVARCSCGRVMEYCNKISKRNRLDTNIFLACSGFKRGLSCTNDRKFFYGDLENLILDWVTDIRMDEQEAHRSTVLSFKLEGKIAERADTQRRMEESLDKWGGETSEIIKKSLYRNVERFAAMIPVLDDEIIHLESEVRSSKRDVIDDRRAMVKRVRDQMKHLSGEPLWEVRAKLAAAVRGVIDNIEFNVDGSFFVTLRGGLKAYRFVNGAYDGSFDLVGIDPTGDPNMTFPTVDRAGELGIKHDIVDLVRKELIGLVT